jgi:tetratricopeptide (TPR) repeat protein
MAGPKHTELPAVVVPQHLWLRSARPAQGKIVQWALPGTLVLAGLLVPGTTLRVSLVLAGIGLFLLLPAMILGRLEQLGQQVATADRKRAAELLKELPERPVVRLFAPVGWQTLQQGLLHLKLGDGNAAAAAFAETARLCLQPEAVMLVSAQAHALVLAGDRAKARDHLEKLQIAKLIGPRDQLDLGIVLLIETKKFKPALSHIEAARKAFGEHPRVLAALALAMQKLERIDEASELLEQAQIAIKDEQPDAVTDDLIKRARKGLQDYLEAQLRRERRARSRRTTIVVSSEAAASEIVSGEISGGDSPQGEPQRSPDTRDSGQDEAPKRFQAVETPKAEPEPAAPVKPARREADAPREGLEIDLYSVPHVSAAPRGEPARAKKEEPKKPEPKKEEAKPQADSLAAALAGVTAPPSGAPVKLEAVPGKAEPPRVEPLKTEPPKVEPPKVEPPVETGAPTFRRRQTLLGTLPTAEPSKPPAPTLPTISEPNKPPAPNLPSLNTLAGEKSPAAPLMPKSGLPTRANPPAPPAKGAPTFSAPKRDDDKKE